MVWDQTRIWYVWLWFVSHLWLFFHTTHISVSSSSCGSMPAAANMKIKIENCQQSCKSTSCSNHERTRCSFMTTSKAKKACTAILFISLLQQSIILGGKLSWTNTPTRLCTRMHGYTCFNMNSKYIWEQKKLSRFLGNMTCSVFCLQESC